MIKGLLGEHVQVLIESLEAGGWKIGGYRAEKDGVSIWIANGIAGIGVDGYADSLFNYYEKRCIWKAVRKAAKYSLKQHVCRLPKEI